MHTFNMLLQHKHINWRTIGYGVFVALGAIGISGLIFAVVIFFTIESYFIPSPYIDTTFSAEFTWEKWQQISPGMTKSAVRNLLGNPYSELGGYYDIKSGENYLDDCDLYSEDGAFKWYDFAWIGMQVCYDNNSNVIGKSETIHYN